MSTATTTDTIRLLVSDDDPLVRLAIRGMAATHDRIEVVAEASDGAEALAVANDCAPTAILLDVHMPRVGGIEALLSLRRSHPDVPVLLMSTVFHDDSLDAALSAGASGCLCKLEDMESMLAAIIAAVQGNVVISAGLARQLAARLGSSPAHRDASAIVERLTDRERAVGLGIAKGKTNAEIAAELFVSVATIKACVAGMLSRLEVDNRVQIAVRLHDAGLC